AQRLFHKAHVFQIRASHKPGVEQKAEEVANKLAAAGGADATVQATVRGVPGMERFEDAKAALHRFAQHGQRYLSAVLSVLGPRRQQIVERVIGLFAGRIERAKKALEKVAELTGGASIPGPVRRGGPPSERRGGPFGDPDARRGGRR